MVEVGRIREIWRYPVKSMAGERITEVGLGERGLHADRMWAVRDIRSNVTTSAKRLPGLLWCSARFAGPPPPDAGPGNAAEVIITFPDGTEVSSADSRVHAALSAYVDRDVELRPLPPVTEKGQYRGRMMTKNDLRTILGIDAGEPMPDLSMFPVKKLAEITMYATPVGSYADAYPLHMMTVESLATMGRLAPDSDFDVRRFRPSMLIETGSSADFPEWDWCGGVLHAPGADLNPEIPTIRCVMPSHEQPELKRDREVSRAIAASARRCLGVYGSVSRAGIVAVGDPLDLEPPARRSTFASKAGAGVARIKKVAMRAGTAAMPRG